MYKFIIFLSVSSALFAMEKEQTPIIESESSVELVLDGYHHILPLKDVLNHVVRCQKICVSKDVHTISGFHVYAPAPHKSLLKEGVTLGTFTPLHQVVAVEDSGKFHQGYVIHQGVADVKTFFPVGWQKKDVIAYIHRLMTEGTVHIQEEKRESCSMYKTYIVTVIPASGNNEDVPVQMVIKGCPRISKSMHILTLFPLINKKLPHIEQDIRELVQRQKTYNVSKKVPSQQQQVASYIKVPKLIEAVEQQDYQKVLNMLSIEADPEVTTSEGVTPLMRAALSGNTELVSLLLMHEASCATSNKKGATPLHYAAQGESFRCVLMLCDLDTINKQNNDGHTPLMLAATYKHIDNVELLLRSGANPHIQDKYKRTALMLAVQALQEEKDDNDRCKAIIELLHEHNTDVDTQDSEGNTALMHAVMLDRLSLVNLLLDYGADVSLVNAKGETALVLAKKYNGKAIVQSIEQFMQKKRAWLEENKATELMYAVHTKNVSAVKKLLAQGVNVNEHNEYNVTALMYAVEHEHQELVEILLQMGADPRILSPYGISICDYAQKHKSKLIASTLLTVVEGLNAPLREREQKEKEALQQKYQVLQSDIRKGSLTEERKAALLLFKNKKISRDGCTPFLYAIREKKYELAQQIIELQCASTSSVDDKQRDAFVIAFDNRDTASMKLLIEHGIIREESILTCCKRALDNKDIELVRFIASQLPTLVYKMILNIAREGDISLFNLCLAQEIVKFGVQQAGEALLELVSTCSVEIVEAFLTYYPRALDYANEHGETIVMRAVKSHNIKMVTVLCSSGADIHAKTKAGHTALYYAQSQTPLVACLQEFEQKRKEEALQAQEHERRQRVTEELKAQGYCHAMIAAYFNDHQTLRQGITSDLNYVHERGITPLIVAVQQGNTEAVQALLECPHLELNTQDNQGCTALHYAVLGKRYEISSMLVQSGASVLCRNKAGKTISDLINFKGIPQTLKELVKQAETREMEILCRKLAAFSELTELSQESVGEEFETLNRNSFLELLNDKHKLEIIEYLIKEKKTGALRLLFDKAKYGYLVKSKEVENFLFSYGVTYDLIKLCLDYGLPATYKMLFLVLAVDAWDIAELLVQKGNLDISTISDFSEELKDFIIRNKVTALEFLLKQGLPINIQDKDGSTPLTYACDAESKEVVEMLLKVPSIDIHHVNKRGWTPLMAACIQGSREIVEILLRAGACITESDPCGAIALSAACISKTKDRDVVKMLLCHGADPKYVLPNGNTVLHCACDSSVPEVVKCLIEAGANPHARNTAGMTPLMQALIKGNEEIVQLLLSLPHIDVEGCDNNGNSPLILALSQGSYETVKLLLEYGANVNRLTTQGGTLLLVACEKQDEKLMQLLLDAGADIDQQNKLGGTPLIGACEKKNKELVTLLLERGANIEKSNKFGGNPLLAAVEVNSLDIVQLLLNKGACPNVQNFAGGTPLMGAAERGSYDIVKLLVEKGAKLDIVSKEGCTALLFACMNQRLDVARYLIEKGASINIQNKIGNTALILACDNRTLGSSLTVESTKKQEELVKLLLQAGANVQLKNQDGFDAIDLAGKVSAIGVKKILTQHMKKLQRKGPKLKKELAEVRQILDVGSLARKEMQELEECCKKANLDGGGEALFEERIKEFEERYKKQDEEKK